MWERVSRLQRESVVAAAAFTLLLFALFFPFLFGNANLLSAARQQPSIYPIGASGNSPAFAERMLLDDNGSGATVEPVTALEHHIIFKEHRAPLWNRDDAFGMPLAAAMQEGTFCPFDFLNELDPSPQTYSWYVVVRLFCAGFFAFLFLRFYVRALAAWTGGAAFMLTGYFILFASMPHLSIECLIPAAFYFTERVLRKPTLETAASLAVVAGLLSIGGFPEATLLAFLFVTCYVMLRVVNVDQLGASRLKLVSVYFGATAIGFTSSAVLLLPFAEFAHVSSTTHALNSGPPRGISDVDTRPELLFGQYLAPLSTGPIWHGLLTGGTDYNGIRGYWGVVAFFLAVVGLVNAVGRRAATLTTYAVGFFSFSTVLLLAKRFGNPLVNWIGYLPGLNLVSFTKYEEPLIGFGIAALCAFGLEAILSRQVGLRTWSIATIVVLIVLNVTNHDLAVELGPLSASNYFNEAYWLAIGAYVCVVAISFAFTSDRPIVRLSNRTLAIASHGFAGLLVLELTFNFFVPIWYVKNVQPTKATNPYAGAPYVTYLERHLALGERMYAEGGYMQPNWQAAFDLPDIRANEAIYSSRYLPLVQKFVPVADCNVLVAFVGCDRHGPDDPALQRLFTFSGVKYVVTPRTLGSRLFERVYRGGATIYRFNANASRARIFHDVRFEPSADLVLSGLADPKNDVTKTAFVEHADAIGFTPLQVASMSRRGSPSDLATFSREDSASLMLRTRSTRAGMLVLSDTYYPGWKAYVDGEEKPISRADYLFRGVFLEAGTHTIEFRYEPRSYVVGSIVSAICVFVILAAYGLHAFRRKSTVDVAQM